MPSEVDYIIHTSVADGLSSAELASEATIRRAIACEKKRKKPRVALLTGLVRELRRRSKGKS